jgi:hypothetical protein
VSSYFWYAGELLAVKEVTVIEGEKGAEAVQQLEQEVGREGGGGRMQADSGGCCCLQVGTCYRLAALQQRSIHAVGVD